MKALIGGTALTLALLLSGCGDKGDNNATTSTAAANGSAPAPVVKAPNGDWSEVVVETPEGGFRMGNPNAPVKLVEFGSLTCSHCAAFSAEGAPELIDKYVKTGQVSYEFRNFIRDGLDLAASLVTRCGGPKPYFKFTEQVFATQPDWFKKLQGMSEAEQQALSAQPPAQQALGVADAAGFIQFAKVRGIPEEKVKACLTDQKAMQQLVDMQQQAIQSYNIQGTPTFVINGNVVPNAGTWDALEPAIKEALG